MSIQRYQLKNRKLDKMSFHLLYISTSRYEGDWHSTPHAHHCTELFYVSSGKGSFLVNDDVFDVKADDLIIVNPNVPHTEMSRDESPLEYIVLGIEGLQFTSFTNHMEYEDYEKAALEEEYKKFQAMGLKLNMARGKPGPHQMDLAMGLNEVSSFVLGCSGLTKGAAFSIPL